MARAYFRETSGGARSPASNSFGAGSSKVPIAMFHPDMSEILSQAMLKVVGEFVHGMTPEQLHQATQRAISEAAQPAPATSEAASRRRHRLEAFFMEGSDTNMDRDSYIEGSEDVWTSVASSRGSREEQ